MADNHAQELAALRERIEKMGSYLHIDDKRGQLAELEAQMEIDDERHEALVTLMADETLYADQERFEAAMTEYNELKARMTANEAEWLELSATIELELKQMGEDA